MSKNQLKKISNSAELIAALKKYDLGKEQLSNDEKNPFGGLAVKDYKPDSNNLKAFEDIARDSKNKALDSFLQEKPLALVSNENLSDILQNFDKDQKLEVTKNILAKTKPDQAKSTSSVADILKQFDTDQDRSEVLKLLHARTPLKKLTTEENQSIAKSFEDQDAAKSTLSAINPPSLFSQITDRIKKLFAPEKKYVFDAVYAKSPNEMPDIIPSASIKAVSAQTMSEQENRKTQIHNSNTPSATPASPQNSGSLMGTEQQQGHSHA
jgi:hypothetical protein